MVNGEYKKEAITIGEQVPAGTEVVNEFLFDGAGYLTGEMQLRFYKGPELSLQLSPYLIKRDGTKIALINYGGTKGYIDGEDDFFTFNINFEVDTKDKLVVVANNTSSEYDYDYRLNATYNRGPI